MRKLIVNFIFFPHAKIKKNDGPNPSPKIPRIKMSVISITQLYTLSSDGQEIPFEWYSPPKRSEDFNQNVLAIRRFKKNVEEIIHTFFKINGENFWTNISNNEELKLIKLAEMLEIDTSNEDLIMQIHSRIVLKLSGMEEHEKEGLSLSRLWTFG